MNDGMLTTIRLAAITTQDPVTRKLLLDTIGEDQNLAIKKLHSSEWAEMFELGQDPEEIKTNLLKGILTSFKESINEKPE